MKDRDFDDLMRKWADSAAASAPEIRPTEAVYEAARSLRKAGRPLPFFRRWLALSAAAAALLVLAIIYPVLFRPSPGPPPWLGRELEIVGLREIPVASKGTDRLHGAEKGAPQADALSPKRGKKGPGHRLRRMDFQFETEHSPDLVAFDIRRPREESISLTPADSYRLALEPVDDLHIYVFQLSPSGVLVELFPNETYSQYLNPLRGGIPYYLPPEPSWFHLGREKGEEHLYLLASSVPLTDLEDLYAEYAGESTLSRREAMLSDLVGRIENVMAGSRSQASGWMLPFQHR